MTLELHYKKSPFFDETFPLVSELLHFDTNNLATYNANAICKLAEHMQIETEIVRSSSLPTSNTSTQRLIDLVKAVDGTVYYSGKNAAETYQQNELFEEQGIELLLENFQFEPYAQQKTSEFVPGLSVIDALMNVGAKDTATLVRG